ncbi:hypothetical protein [Aestuariivita boseongensis]|uniref:hypothetical protein n=1 Tax=Aestuariivita boseongensis TaxID=1470562 RepID=UPI0012F7F93F|nr:hypothetical protein [Aestuariivita boseongensis]
MFRNLLLDPIFLHYPRKRHFRPEESSLSGNPANLPILAEIGALGGQKPTQPLISTRNFQKPALFAPYSGG